MEYHNERIVKTHCKLKDGSVHEYDYCSADFHGYDNYPVFKKLVYIGEGVFYMANGVVQHCFEMKHFWKKI